MYKNKGHKNNKSLTTPLFDILQARNWKSVLISFVSYLSGIYLANTKYVIIKVLTCFNEICLLYLSNSYKININKIASQTSTESKVCHY